MNSSTIGKSAIHRGVRLLSASTLEGDEVKNPQGEKMGKIEELMIDLNSGRIAYAVLSFGGFLGLGTKLFAIPWDALEVDTDEKVFRLGATKEQLKNAKGFDKDQWPQFTPEWHTETYAHYGVKPYWEA